MQVARLLSRSARLTPRTFTQPTRLISVARPIRSVSRSTWDEVDIDDPVVSKTPLTDATPNASVVTESQASAPYVPPTPATSNGASAPAEPLTETSFNDWSRSFHGLSAQPFPKEIAEVLMTPVDAADIEMKPDGLIYLPEIKYRRILNKAFGPGGWGLAPRAEVNVGPKVVSREYALVCMGRLVAIARGEQQYFDPSGIPTATEACKSNALMRCCKDLGIASELWDPRFIREFKAQHCVEVFVEHVPTKKKRKLWRRKDDPKFEYPYKES
ncbi:hypothetical protein FRC03_005502 [Tulasnella sp. 419]|nr:hypothetical protein FRC03_005502 [Tulasnella sp. 419]